MLRAFTDGYQRNKVKEYVVCGHEPLKILLHFLELNLSGNLIGKLEVQKSSIKNYYFDFVSDKKLSSYEHTKFADDYFRRISKIETKQEELASFSEILQEITGGHNVLYTNMNNFEDHEVKGKIARLGTSTLKYHHVFVKIKVNRMANITSEQVKQLADNPLRMTNTLGDYRYENFERLMEKENLRIKELHNLQMENTTELYTKSQYLFSTMWKVVLTR